MRIISGEYKGRVLNTQIPSGVRPTTDKNRETIFNILNNFVDFDEINALDLFAGAGLLGIETLSRGANRVIFNDNNPKVTKLIENFLKELEIENDRYYIYNSDGILFLNQLLSRHENKIENENKVNLIYSDPPYNLRLTKKILETIANQVNDNCEIYSTAILVMEYSYLETINYESQLFSERYEVLKQKTLGETKIDFLQLK